ncbi:MAG: DUF3306 domain-containing protein [Telluria sp.]|nr:DUF3306 domain-containing protein [Telluria sp.]
MADERFLQRWSRLKREPRMDAPAEKAPAAMEKAAPNLPTLEDVAQLTAESDFSVFVSQGVDKAVQRMAMKKLFADPHFGLMDGLDVYIDDYTLADPVSEAMLASLHHARDIFTRAANAETERAQRLAPGGAPEQQAAAVAGQMDGKSDGADKGDPEAHRDEMRQAARGAT